MKINFDLHTHTVYSHGKGTIAENAKSAAEKGLYGIGITDHGFSHPAFGMRRKKLDARKLRRRRKRIRSKSAARHRVQPARRVRHD